jgi:hypothetical protein
LTDRTNEDKLRIDKDKGNAAHRPPEQAMYHDDTAFEDTQEHLEALDNEELRSLLRSLENGPLSDELAAERQGEGRTEPLEQDPFDGLPTYDEYEGVFGGNAS